MHIIVTIQGERYKINHDHDLGILVLRYSQRHGKDVGLVLLRIERTSAVISFLDHETTAQGVLIDGDVLREVPLPGRPARPVLDLRLS